MENPRYQEIEKFNTYASRCFAVHYKKEAMKIEKIKKGLIHSL